MSGYSNRAQAELGGCDRRPRGSLYMTGTPEYLRSDNGSEFRARIVREWLQTILGDAYRVHFLKDVYYGSHIDSTFVALRPGLMICNPARLNDDTLPEILKQWNVIYSPPMENTDRYDADYLSKSIGSNWIDMNLFSISPNLLGGGCHCVTLDIRRTGTLQRYFD